MNLYNQAEKNVFRSYLYLFGFFILIVALGWVLSYVFEGQWILYVAVALSIIMSFSSYWYSDRIILSVSKARPIKKEEYPEIYRVTENLAISNGLPMPRLYVIDDLQPNAFATGRDPEHGVVAVTTGLLQRLERAELEAVIAHELAHIGNRDILLQSIVVVLVGVVVIVADFFFRAAFFGGVRQREGGNALLLVGALVFLILAPILAQVMKLAISRRREYLADSTAALTTRHPEALARALEKLAKDPHQLKVANDATAHLYVVSPFRGKEEKSWIRKLFMTHPPIEDRIKKLREKET